MNLNLDSILSLISNPAIAALIAAFLGPMLAGLPWLKPILSFTARLAGYELVPVVTPKAEARMSAKEELDAARVEYQREPCEKTQARYETARDAYAAIGDGTLMEKIKPYLPLIIGGVVLFLVMGKGGGCNKTPAPEVPAVKKVLLQ